MVGRSYVSGNPKVGHWWSIGGILVEYLWWDVMVGRRHFSGNLNFRLKVGHLWNIGGYGYYGGYWWDICGRKEIF